MISTSDVVIMVALRTVACSDRWEEAWPQIVDRLRAQIHERSAQRRSVRTAPPAAAEAPTAAVLASATAVVPTFEAPVAAVTDVSPSVACPGNDTTTKEPWRPTANHAWRRLSIGKTHQEQLAC